MSDASVSSGSADGPVVLSADPSAYREARGELLSRPVAARSPRRLALSTLTDDWLGKVFVSSGAAELGACLVAVGGYGRGSLTAGSDLDLLLVLPDRVDAADSHVAAVVDQLWYPVWDTGVRVDHSVRTPAEVRRAATRDVRVILGLLDARPIAGDITLGERVASSILADWRALARTRLGEVRESVVERRARHGEAAHLLEPDIKESYGGLRDAGILDAVAASWVTDVPREGLADVREMLLDVRDALHDCALSEGRRPSDVLRTQDQDDVAHRMGLEGREALLRDLGAAARAIAYASDTTWHRLARLERGRSARQVRRRLRRPGPERVPLAEGVVVHDGEVALAADARPERDPVLVLRVAAAAAQAGLPLAPGAVARLARESAPLPVPWPAEARDALVSLLGSGPGLVTAWEALDQQGLIVRLIPEWAAVRSAPQGNPVHVYRVDRHLVEAAAQSLDHLREVTRPDLLLVGALLHDIGKARPGDHSEVGADLTEGITRRMGYGDADRAVLVSLVLHHLLLPEAATRRDLDDPLTAERVATAVGTVETLELLRALTYADAAATGPGAWSDWKASLVDDLVARTRAHLAGARAPAPPMIAERHAHLLAGEGVEVILERGVPASRIIVAAPDRSGLLGAIAGVLAVHRLDVKAADTQTVGDRAITVWTVVPFFGEFPALDLVRSDILRALEGQIDVRQRLAHRRQGTAGPPPRVEFVPGAASDADVLEIRAHDEPALLHRIGAAISDAGATITAARVETLGSEAVDVFYLRGAEGGRLPSHDRARIIGAVLEQLQHGQDEDLARTI
jgi:[protein-PII] uridylyltransferase